MESTTPNEQNSIDIWPSFIYDVIKTTYLLFVLLEGAEMGNYRKHQNYKNWASDIRAYSNIPANLSYMDAMLSIHGTDIGDLLSRNGHVEQLAYKGWVVEVYGIWEDQYRSKLEESFNTDDSIRPQINALGDLRLIRNDLVHCNGKTENSAKGECEVLKWFNLNEKMIFHIHHILDFLNQIGGVGAGHFISKKTKPIGGACWNMEKKEKLLFRNPTPKIISIRLDAGAFDESVDTATDYEMCFASIVFDNGFFADIPFYLESRKVDSERLSKPLREVSITSQGDLLLPTGEIMTAKILYSKSVEFYFMSNEEKNIHQSGIKIRTASPPIKFRQTK